MKDKFNLINWINTFVLGIVAAACARGMYAVVWRSQGFIAIVAAVVSGWLTGYLFRVVWLQCRPRYLLIIGALIGYILVGIYGAQSLRTSPDEAEYLFYIWLVLVVLGPSGQNDNWLKSQIQNSLENSGLLILPVLYIGLAAVVTGYIGFCIPDPDSPIQWCPPRAFGISISGPNEVYVGEPVVFEIEANRNIETEDVSILLFDVFRKGETILPIAITRNAATFQFDNLPDENGDETFYYTVAATVGDLRTDEIVTDNYRIVVRRKP